MAAGSDGSLRYNGESVDMNDDKKKGGTGLRVLLIILAVLIVAAGGLLVFNNQSMKAVDPSDDTAVIVEIPEGCGSIGAGAFRNCRNLTQIRIPASIDEIAETAFDGCGTVYIFSSSELAEEFCSRHANCIYVADAVPEP